MKANIDPLFPFDDLLVIKSDNMAVYIFKRINIGINIGNINSLVIRFN